MAACPLQKAAAACPLPEGSGGVPPAAGRVEEVEQLLGRAGCARGGKMSCAGDAVQVLGWGCGGMSLAVLPLQYY